MDKVLLFAEPIYMFVRFCSFRVKRKRSYCDILVLKEQKNCIFGKFKIILYFCKNVYYEKFRNEKIRNVKSVDNEPIQVRKDSRRRFLY